MDAIPPNRIVAFCKGAPAPTVVRVHLHAGSDAQHLVEVERVYGATAPTSQMAQRFASTPEDETLLVALAPDGAVLGTAWPVFRDKVSLEFGIPDLSEAEAASLLTSPKCDGDLRAFRDKGARPIAAESHGPGGGCAHCSTAGSSSAFDVSSALLLTFATIAAARVLRRAPAAAARFRRNA